MRSYIIRVPLPTLVRLHKDANTLLPSTRSFTENVFVDFFTQECAFRYNVQRDPYLERQIKYMKLLERQAKVIWEFSKRYKKSAVNVAFIFLNRYFALFSGPANPLPKMSYYWSTFVIEIMNDKLLWPLMNYNEDRRRTVTGIIREFIETTHSRKFHNFVGRYCKGYKVVWPSHFSERSKVFEIVLIMLNQIEDAKLKYFYENHSMEVLKAHVWALQKFGDPVVIHLGHLIGEVAMGRLKQYKNWLRREGLISDSDYVLPEENIGERGIRKLIF